MSLSYEIFLNTYVVLLYTQFISFCLHIHSHVCNVSTSVYFIDELYRVNLRHNGQPGSDYINASFINVSTFVFSNIDICAYIVHGEYMLKTVLSASYQLIMSKHV